MRNGYPFQILLSAIVILLVVVGLHDIAMCDEVESVSQTTTTTVVDTSPVPPPPLRQEVITQEPSPGYVWIRGSWERTPDAWNWVSGRWVKPPFLRARYISGYWRYDQGRYLWSGGHWAAAPQGLVVQKPIAPPPTFQETIPAPPSEGQTWIPGHWDWNGANWVWLPGYHSVPPQPQAQWVSGYWSQGLLGFWRWTPGHWTAVP